MTKEIAEKIVRGITDKIECNTVDIDDWAEFWGFTREEYEEFLDMAVKAIEQQPCGDAISREQAIDAVADLFEMSEYPHPYSQGKPIRLKDIKEKLKQLPPVQPKLIECEDAISRQAAIDEIKSHYRVDNDLLEVIAYKISKLPPVQPKPKTGHWIKITPSGIYMCSECEQNVLTGDIDVYHYCHHCGARMINPHAESEDKE